MDSKWHTSSHSNGAACVQARCMQAEWAKSSHSGSNGGGCVETRSRPGTVQVRDSKLGDASPVLSFAPESWQAFVDALKEG